MTTISVNSVWKKADRFKKRGFYYFLNRWWRGFDPPRAYATADNKWHCMRRNFATQDFRCNEGFQVRLTLYFSKIKTTQVELLYTKSTQVNVKVAKKNYSKKYSLPKKTTQVIYSSKSISLLYTTVSLPYSSRNYVSLRKWIGEVAVPFIICKFYCFLKVFVILFFNQYLISRLSSAMSSAKKRNIVDEKRVF